MVANHLPSQGADRGHKRRALTLRACFSVAYDPEVQLLYLAVLVRDDELFVGRTSPMDTDSIEVHVDGLHTD